MPGIVSPDQNIRHFAIHDKTVVFHGKVICRAGTASCLSCGYTVAQCDVQSHRCISVPEWVRQVIEREAETRRLRSRACTAALAAAREVRNAGSE